MIAPHERPPTGPTAALASRMQAMIPVIETARLRLRAPRIEDFGTYADIAGGARSEGIGGELDIPEDWDAPDTLVFRHHPPGELA